MVQQVYAFPDSKGVIRISCGGDELEIVVMQKKNVVVATGTTAAWEFRDNPADTPVVLENPSDAPVVWIDVPHANDGKADIEKLFANVKLQFADQNRPDPHAVVLRVAQANLHEVHRLGERVAETMLPLAIDFGGFSKG